MTAADYTDNNIFVSGIKAKKIEPYCQGKRKRSAYKDLLLIESRKTVMTIVVIQFLLIGILSFSAYHVMKYGTDLFSNKIDKVFFSLQSHSE